MLRLSSLAAALVLAAAPAGAASVDPERISAHVRTLASDAFEGRGPGTAGEDKTIAYLTREFAAAGARPGGRDGAWTQEVEMVRFTVSRPATPQIAGGACPASIGRSLIAWSRKSGGRVAVKDAPLVFVGFGVSAPDKQWDDFAGLDVRGKVAVVLTNDPDFAQATGPFRGADMTYYGRWSYKVEELARRGAAGAIVIHEEGPTGLPWALIETVYRQPMLDIPRGPGERVGFESWLPYTEAEKLFACAGRDLGAWKAMAQKPAFRGGRLGELSLSLDFDVTAETQVTRNVLARLPGARRPGETVVVTAHWDHMGIGAPDSTGDTIYNGALDNAGGVAGLLELARTLAAGPPLDRSVLFLAVTLEERGLLGAEYYAANPVWPLEKTVGGINMDAVNFFGPVDNMTLSGYGANELEDWLREALAERGRKLLPNPNDAVGFYFRSDHFPFVKRGVPVLFAGAGWDIADRLKNVRDPEVGARFHQPSDEWGEDLDFKAAAADMEVYRALLTRLANSDWWPGWKPGWEFGRPTPGAAAAS